MLIPGVEIPHLCLQCEDYPCVRACPEKALSVNGKTGAVKVDASRCTACGICVKACPGNVPHLHPREKSVVICDLCDGKPKCVKACQEGRWKALTSIPGAEATSRRALAKTPRVLTREVAIQILGEKTTREALGR